jgi:uncharacterized protein YgbK (DUF1537 family)
MPSAPSWSASAEPAPTMSSLPHIVLADDLTGAAEVAAIAHQAGLHAVVLTRLPVGPVDADVLVFDTDTRLAPPREVARRQVSACARALGRRRTFLIPSNPSLGRVIHQGRYFVNGQPLQATAFARDPHHPRHTDEVLTLLGPARPAPALCRARARQLPLGARIVIGEASNAADIAHWAGRLDETTLPAGAADFFRAWLEHQRGEKCTGLRYTLPAGGVLLLHGTITGECRPDHRS